MCMLLLLLFFGASPILAHGSPVPTGPPSLIVQVVDPGWIPIRGAEVTVKPLSGNAQSSVKRTDKEGYVKFFVPSESDYSIAVKVPGFKNERLKRLHLFKPSGEFPTAYVQLQMHLSAGVTIY